MEKRSCRAFPLLLAVFMALGGVGCNRSTPQAESAGPSDAPTTRSTEAAATSGQSLPDSAFRLAWGNSGIPATVERGATFPIAITVTNRSTATWPDLQTADPSHSGAYAVRLAYRWLRATDLTPLQDYGPRVELPKALRPGDSVTLTATVTAPDSPGRFGFQFDLVQELVAWFESKGMPTLIVPINVR